MGKYDDLAVPDFDFDDEDVEQQVVNSESEEDDIEVDSDEDVLNSDDSDAEVAEDANKKHEVIFAEAPAANTIPEHLRTHMQWSELRLSRPFIKALHEMGFAEPTPIQRDAIPKAMEGRDIMATSETGSGKTAAFLLPILERLMLAPSIRGRKQLADGRWTSTGVVGTRALILLPTRELAQQCYAMLAQLTKYAPVTSAVIAGGFEMREQQMELRKQPDIVVATPGRILDMLMNAQGVHMELLEVVVFDEADRLLELGFKEECLQILKHCAPSRQTLMFSATFSEKVTDLAAVALSKPVRIAATKVSKVAKSIEQEFLELPNEQAREAALVHLLTAEESIYKDRTIVFFPTKQTAHRMYIVCKLLKIDAVEIHSNITQQQRSESLRQFASGEVGILLATDVAARGLDLPSVDHVINFTVPIESARYVHRVGRCGRIGRTGYSATLFISNERPQLKALAKAAVPESTGETSRSTCERKLNTKKLNEKVLEGLPEKIKGLERSIKKWVSEEVLEKEARLAGIELTKAENMVKFKDEIAARPKKEWFLSTKEKKQLQEASKSAALAAAEDVANAKGGKGKKRSKEEARLDMKKARGAKEEKRKALTPAQKKWADAAKIVRSGAKAGKRKARMTREHDIDM